MNQVVVDTLEGLPRMTSNPYGVSRSDRGPTTGRISQGLGGLHGEGWD